VSDLNSDKLQPSIETALMVDTHCHINFESYDDDRAAVLERAAEAGVAQIVNPAIDLDTSRAILDLVNDYANLYAAVGIHPNSSADFSPSMLDEVATLANHGKVVAVGEIGLDYYRDYSPKAKQATAFEGQLELAKRLELPVIIHNRDASDDVMAILEDWVRDLPDSLQARPGVLHSFSAPLAIAERALAAGFFIGFTGPVTFKKADDLRRVAAAVPLDRILVETDGPFLTPVPFRGKRNEPAYIPYIVERLASLKTISDAEMAHITTANACRLFQLD
jgi:TatD DNase family protein